MCGTSAAIGLKNEKNDVIDVNAIYFPRPWLDNGLWAVLVCVCYTGWARSRRTPVKTGHLHGLVLCPTETSSPWPTHPGCRSKNG